MTTLALVPARGGSKGLPGKNLAVVGGQSLVARAVAVARSVDRIDEVIVSSDAEDILAEATRAGAHPDRRRPELADDEASLEDVARDVLSRRPNADHVVVLQPTTPLRDAEDVRRCLDALERAPSVATVSRASHPLEWAVRIGADRRIDPVAGWENVARRRQDLPAAFSLNGGVYAVRADYLRGGGSFVGPETVAVEMPPERSVDIDGPFELALARFLAGGP